MENAQNLTLDTNTPTFKAEKENPLELIPIANNIRITREFNLLSESLAKAQQEIGTLQRNKEGYGYNYADLAAVLDCIREPLAKNGITIIQNPDYNEDSKICPITNIITHSSGQMMITQMVVPVTKLGKMDNDTQAYGSAITYARRYALMALMNLAPEDDDGVKAKDLKFKDKAENKKPETSDTPTTTASKPQKKGIQRAQAVTEPPKHPTVETTESKCSDCESIITSEKIIEFSTKNFGKPLCYECQKKHKAAS